MFLDLHTSITVARLPTRDTMWMLGSQDLRKPAASPAKFRLFSHVRGVRQNHSRSLGGHPPGELNTR